MFKKFTFTLVVVLILIGWPLSLIVNPNHLSFSSIFYQNQLDTIDLNQKLGLDTSPIKRFYYNKLTLYKDRYVSNFMVLIDFNNYFYQMHPREDVPQVDYRFKYIYPSFILLISAAYAAINQKKYSKSWLAFLLGIIVLSFFKKVDGLDFILYFPLCFLMIMGLKEINRWRFAIFVNLFISLIGITEVIRLIV